MGEILNWNRTGAKFQLRSNKRSKSTKNFYSKETFVDVDSFKYICNFFENQLIQLSQRRERTSWTLGWRAN